MRAASDISCGICMRNCRIRNIQNACPKKKGTTSGRKVLTHPSLANMSNRATIRTGKGTNTVARTM